MEAQCELEKNAIERQRRLFPVRVNKTTQARRTSFGEQSKVFLKLRLK